jgi:hypothetical protein
MTPRRIQYWVIPEDANSEFVADMEVILDTYAQPYDARYPVICMDEQPVQLTKETRQPIPETLEHPKRVDYEYERAGTASLFMFTEPLVGWRQVSAHPQRTKREWAMEVAHLCQTRYAAAAKIILISDNLNTHTKGAFYEVFPPEVARELVQRIEFRYTPKHGSWLNIAENELSALTRQCLAERRIPDLDSLRQEIEAWATHKNDKLKGVDWQFTTDNARIKLRSLYPKFLS